MKIPYPFRCENCGSTDPVEINLARTSPEWVCESCGHKNAGIFHPGFTIGWKILIRSDYELRRRKDHSMSIVLSAMAFDCDLSRLFLKWSEVGELQSGKAPDMEELERKLRGLLPMRRKIETVGRLIDSRGVDDFVQSSEDLQNSMKKLYPAIGVGPLAEDLERSLFWPRNRILHLGEAEFVESEASLCYRLSEFGLNLFETLDRARIA